ncbi:adenylate/guanylate cyclase domain-containing protein [Duganella sp. FT134W]|uniref:Adenylate/guanylate cyclase domain-containing protein n=1 Tax=Duganella margarita TaxID=2692170 RepID=A0A7X4H7M7_9BURK|nr:adenylate/guanylate cyclase domain-containing protein [Duganella margarita]MYM76069.1 adenylate/guanylate cyclase domain-containing protein [Duganella margarita]
MTFKEDLLAASKKIFADQWTTTAKTVVPVAADLRLGNDAGEFKEMVVLYADLDGSTAMVDTKKWEFSAEVYKSYLHCAAKIIKTEGGEITAYDGDRIMAVFVGDWKNTNAVTAALKINYALTNIVNPAMKSIYTTDFVIKHSIGIDVSPIRVARIGVKNDNDLVWVGRAANHAAKLTAIPVFGPVWISEAVYTSMKVGLRKHQDGTDAWELRKWSQMNDLPVYRSNSVIAFD